MLHLEQLGRFVPPATRAVAELQEPLGLTDTQVAYFTRYLGLDRIATAPGLDLGDMLADAAEDALAGVDRDAVRYVVHAHTMQHVVASSPYRLEDLRERLGLRTATVFATSHLNCVSGLYAVELAAALLDGAPPEDKVLVVTGDKILTPQARLMPDITVMGEAAAACVVGRDPRGDRVLGRAFTVLGRFHRGLDCDRELQAEYKTGYPGHLRDVMAAALADAGRDAAEVDLVVPHNVNRLNWKKVCRELGIPMGKVFLDNVPRYGHCWGSDSYLNLRAARESGAAGPGDVVLLATAGLGAGFAAMVLEIGPGMPARNSGADLIGVAR